jgi:hypothetical protein
MAVSLPSTGGTYQTLFQPGWDPLAIRKGIITNVIIGDYLVNGVPVNLNNCGTVNVNGVPTFTPFALDGTVRSDLLASSASPTLMGFNIGLMKDDGWNFDPKITVDETPVAQDIWSARNDVTKAEGGLNFTAREWKPLLWMLQMDYPTLNAAGTQSVVPDLGTANISMGAQGYQNLCERWIIAFGFDGQISFSITIPRCSQKELGKMEANKKNPFDTMLNYNLVKDPNTNMPYIYSAGGAGWVGLGGSPSFPSSPSPTATPVTGLKVTITFPAPTGMDVESVTYTATKTTGGVTTALTIPSSGAGAPSVSGGIVSFTGTGLTASAVYTGAVVTATGDNNATATLAIPTFTATGS